MSTLHRTQHVPVWLAVVATSLPILMSTLDNLIVTGALPAIHADLGVSIEGLQWPTNAYTPAFVALMPLAVGLGDRFGGRHIFVAGIATFMLTSVLCAVSADRPGSLPPGHYRAPAPWPSCRCP